MGCIATLPRTPVSYTGHLPSRGIAAGHYFATFTPLHATLTGLIEIFVTTVVSEGKGEGVGGWRMLGCARNECLAGMEGIGESGWTWVRARNVVLKDGRGKGKGGWGER